MLLGAAPSLRKSPAQWKGEWIMRTYTRAWIQGGCYFFTVNLAQRHSNSLLIDHIELLRRAFKTVQATHPFTMDAMVVLPDHLHCIWRLPKGDDRFDSRWRLIKTAFSRSLVNDESISITRQRKGERGIWQRRYWEHVIRDEADWRRHVDYIHYNPVKHGYVERAFDWPHSTFCQFIKREMYEVNWLASPDIVEYDQE